MMCTALLVFCLAVWLGRAGWQGRDPGDDHGGDENPPEGPTEPTDGNSIGWDDFDRHRQEWEHQSTNVS